MFAIAHSTVLVLRVCIGLSDGDGDLIGGLIQ